MASQPNITYLDKLLWVLFLAHQIFLFFNQSLKKYKVRNIAKAINTFDITITATMGNTFLSYSANDTAWNQLQSSYLLSSKSKAIYQINQKVYCFNDHLIDFRVKSTTNNNNNEVKYDHILHKIIINGLRDIIKELNMTWNKKIKYFAGNRFDWIYLLRFKESHLMLRVIMIVSHLLQYHIQSSFISSSKQSYPPMQAIQFGKKKISHSMNHECSLNVVLRKALNICKQEFAVHLLLPSNSNHNNKDYGTINDISLSH